ncbi:MAG: hypothetical protein WAX07_08990 [Candidatus Altiarchaeia archaeon]
MAKHVMDSERMLVGWGVKGGRRCFFIVHKDLPETKGNPICCDPKDLEKKMMELADRIDEIRKAREKQ